MNAQKQELYHTKILNRQPDEIDDAELRVETKDELEDYYRCYNNNRPFIFYQKLFHKKLQVLYDEQFQS